MKGSSKKLQARLDRIRERAKKKLLVGKFTRLFIVLGPGGDVPEEQRAEIRARRAGKIKGYSGVSPEDWPQHDDVLTVELPIRRTSMWDPEAEVYRTNPEPTPQEAPSEAEPPEYVEYELEPTVEAVLDEPEEVQPVATVEDEPDDHADGRYGNQQRWADPDKKPKKPKADDPDRGWETWRG